MELKKNLQGTTLHLAIEGRIDTTTAPRLEAELRNSISGVTALYLDFTDVQYISSAGLRVLLSAQKVMNRQGKMVVQNVNETVMDVLDVTGFVDILTIE